ncbi:MAG: IS1 family transposase [Cyclobacteriaceae bacterium]
MTTSKLFLPTNTKFGKTKKRYRATLAKHVERFFSTLRQRCSRLVRKSLSFSKKLERHINSIKFVATHYNLSFQT